MHADEVRQRSQNAVQPDEKRIQARSVEQKRVEKRTKIQCRSYLFRSWLW